ncbi:MAG: hypothetical protein H0V40_02850 [Actinobacteria bacterium]|nr:hypothetical protein [Actinomycetota bacterium]
MAVQREESGELGALRAELAGVIQQNEQIEAELRSLEERKHEVADRLELLRRVASDFEVRIAEKEEELARAQRAEERWRAALETRNATALVLGDTLEEALAAFQVLEQRRVEARAAREEFETRANAENPTWAEFVDEPEFRPGGWERLVDAITAGPERPLAQLESAREERRRRDEELLQAAVERGGVALTNLPEHLLEEGLRRREQRLGEPEPRASA